MAWITQNKQKALFSLWSLKVKKQKRSSEWREKIVIMIMMIVTKLIIITIK